MLSVRRFVKTRAFGSLPAAAALVLACAGCVERTIEVRTDPPGRRVFVDGRYAGISPVRIPYTHYGTREVSAEDEGSGRASEVIELWPPLYQFFPLDFLTDCVMPFKLSREREVELRIEPAVPGDSHEAAKKRAGLVSAGLELRSRACK